MANELIKVGMDNPTGRSEFTDAQLIAAMGPSLCSITACKARLDGDYFAIWNNPSTGQPRFYCSSCGQRIVSFNERDEIKLKHERRRMMLVKEADEILESPKLKEVLEMTRSIYDKAEHDRIKQAELERLAVEELAETIYDADYRLIRDRTPWSQLDFEDSTREVSRDKARFILRRYDMIRKGTQLGPSPMVAAAKWIETKAFQQNSLPTPEDADE